MNRKLNKKKIIILILIIFIVIVTIVFSILYQKNLYVKAFLDQYLFRKNITENTLPKISMQNGHVFSFNDHIICLEKNVLKLRSNLKN